MAQKSLPILNKVGVSMLWYTTFYYKYYKWMSSQYLYLIYFFNKLFIYIDFIFSKLQWLTFFSTNLYISSRKRVKSKLKNHRFNRPLTSYLVNIGNKFSLINIYYATTLETLQEFNKSNIKKFNYSLNYKLLDKKISNIFYL